MYTQGCSQMYKGSDMGLCVCKPEMVKRGVLPPLRRREDHLTPTPYCIERDQVEHIWGIYMLFLTET